MRIRAGTIRSALKQLVELGVEVITGEARKSPDRGVRDQTSQRTSSCAGVRLSMAFLGPARHGAASCRDRPDIPGLRVFVLETRA